MYFWFSSNVEQFYYCIFKYFSHYFLFLRFYIYIFVLLSHRLPYYIHFVLVFLVYLLHVV